MVLLRVLLINPEKRQRRINLTLGYIGEYLRTKGIDTLFLDRPHFKSISKLENEIEKINPNIVFMASVSSSRDIINLNSFIEISKICKKISDEIKVVFGGYLSSAIPFEMLKNKSVDFIIVGEPEHTFLELVNEIENDGKDLKKIRGIAFRNGENFKRTGNRPLIKNIDSIPMPHPFLPFSNYSITFSPLIKIKYGAMLTSRGCPISCKFCPIKLIFGVQYRTYSINRVIDEIKYLYDKGIDNISFLDSIFPLDKKRTITICKNIIEEGFDINWSCFGHLNFIDKELLYWMKKSGCTSIRYGIESGDQKILNLMNKNIDVSRARRVVSLTKKFGIMTILNFIIGFPTETIETAMRTINLAKSLNSITYFSLMIPYPGTEIYDWAKENNFLAKTGFDQFSLENTMIFNENLKETDMKNLIKIGYRKTILTPTIISLLKEIKNTYDLIYYLSSIKDALPYMF